MSHAAKPTANILIVDDELAMREGLRELMASEGYDSTAVDSVAAARKSMQEAEYDLVFSDLVLDGEDGLSLLAWIKQSEQFSSTPVIMITGYSTVPNAVEAMRLGAFHYVSKPFQLDEVRMLVRRALESRTLHRRNRGLRRELERYQIDREIVGSSADLKTVLDLADRIAPTESPVLIYGETGTGKELLAHRIHDHSRRSESAFITVNSASLPEALLESELFGHTKGAFTGAHADREGLFQAADGGSLFLDEIADINPSAQARLLRVMQSGEVRRIGENTSRRVNVRLIAATHSDLQQAVLDGKFREDLYYRVNVVALTLPPLRDRKEDIPQLAEHFAQQAAVADHVDFLGFDAEVFSLLNRYSWPGNIRELKNVIRRAVILSNGTPITRQVLPANVLREEPSDFDTSATWPHASLEDMESQHIVQVLRATGGNKSRAAEVLGITRPTLRAKMAKYGIQIDTRNTGSTHGTS